MYYLSLTPTFRGVSRKPKAEILVTLGEDEEVTDSEGNFIISNGLEYGRSLLDLKDLD
jgi:hypothetical protein